MDDTSPPSALEDVSDDALTQLHPNYKSALRAQIVLFGIPILVAALVVEAAIAEQGVLPSGVVAGVVMLIILIFVIRLPSRRFNARGYHMSDDRLRVVRGIWWRSDTVVPFGRVQHIDVDQGPLERFFGISTLTLHTAGNHNASVHLPGLEKELAGTMREEIRAHIKRESL